ncbi:MAG: hypothetical protein WBA97_12025 [Actinophytocola sp.]|uniref:hypothetical protein n=1 Tax=Actinophytocola sp. TaxID=1872138 RepID=UPI003C73C1D3
MFDDMTAEEQALVDATSAGRVLTCGDGTKIRAELIRELLLGRRGEPDPRGVRLAGAHVVGTLDLAHVTAVVGLSLVDCVVTNRVVLTAATLPWLVLQGSRLDGGVRASVLRVSGDVDLSRSTITCSVDEGAVRLRDAHLGGIVLDDADVRGGPGPALSADRLTVNSIMRLSRTRLTGRGEQGAIRMHGAHIAGELDLRHATVHNDTGPAINTTNVTVDTNLLLSGAEVSGRGARGAVRLSGLRAGGLLVLDGADLRNPSGPGVRADGAHVGGELTMRNTRVSGEGALGAVFLRVARVAYDLQLVDAVVRNDSGPALYANGLHVEDTVVLERSQVSGGGDGGAIRLRGAQAGGLRCVDSRVRAARGPAVVADQLQARGSVSVERTRLICASAYAAVTLASARVGQQLSVLDTTIVNPSGSLLDVTDFAYGTLTGMDWRGWLHLIRDHTPAYRPSPYQQLAAVERAAGHDGNARDILIAQQHDRRRRAPAAFGSPLTRWFHWLWGALAGYGYRARRTALALLVALAAASGVSLLAGHVTTEPGRHAAAHTTTATTTPGAPCSTIELIGLGLDRGLPLGPTGLRTRCDLDTDTTAGQVFTALLWLVQAAVWGLATLALAGYTGLIRKSS